MASANSSKTKPQNHLRPFVNDKDLKSRKPRDKAFEIPYSSERSLRVTVQTTGTKTFVWRPQVDGKRRKVTIGTYPDISIAQAHIKLDGLKEQRKNGTLFNELPDAPKTVNDLAEIFYRDRIIPHRKRPEIVRRLLDKDILPFIGNRKLESIRTIDIANLVRNVVKRGASTHAGKVLSTVKQMFKFADGNGYIEQSPAYSLEPKNLGVTNRMRERSLNSEEIRAFWEALDKAPRMSAPVRTGLKILLLSGVRSGELIKAEWKHIDFDNAEWFIPEENSKTREWTVPFSSHLLKLFEEMRDYAGDSEWVVPGTDKSKPVTDKVLVKAMTRLFEIKVDDEHILTIPKATPHDLRRTLRSHMDDLNVEPHIAEKCLNHSLGRITETYNTNPMLEQRRDALERWGDYVQVVTGKHNNVTQITREA